MAANRKKLGENTTESKDIINEVMPVFLHDGAREIIWEYALDPNNDSQRLALYRFFDTPFLPKQILSIADCAGPLDEIEFYIRKAYAHAQAREEKRRLSDMLIQITRQAIIGLDQTIRNDQGDEIEEGMAERLLKLHAELFPNTLPQALEQAKLAAPLEEEKEKTTRETANLNALDKVFAAVKKDDGETAAAIQTFRKFVRDTKPEVMTDNRYNLNLIHLLYCAFDILAKRGGELSGGWYGAPANRFCFEIIGAIQKELPNRMRQIVRSGLLDVLNVKKLAARSLGSDGLEFLGVPGSESELGVNSYWDDCGAHCARKATKTSTRSGPFLQFITSAHSSIQNLLYSGRSLTHRGGV